MPETTLGEIEKGKTLMFWSPIEGRDMLVRTGVYKSNLYHAVLWGIHGPVRDRHAETERTRLAKHLQESISKKAYKQALNSYNYEKEVELKLSKLLKEFFKFIQDGKFPKEKETRKMVKKFSEKREGFKMILQLVPEKKILENLKDIDNLVSGCCSEIEEKIGKDKVKQIADRLKTVIQSFSEHLEIRIKSRFIDECKYDAALIFSLLDAKCNRNIYVMNAESRMPVKIAGYNPDGKKNSIILLQIASGDNVASGYGGAKLQRVASGDVASSKYQVVGRLLPEDRIQRDLEPKDTLIKRVREILGKNDASHSIESGSRFERKRESLSSRSVSHKSRNTSCSDSESNSSPRSRKRVRSGSDESD